jgi:hypothetical protein
MIGLRPGRISRATTLDRTARAALASLPPAVRAAVAAAIREQDDEAGDFRATSAKSSGRVKVHAPPPGGPPYVFVVRADMTLTFRSLRELAWARPDLLGVTFDRRWMGDRRSRRLPGHTERRHAERRRQGPEVSWTRRGFVLSTSVLPAQPSPPPPPAIVAPEPEPAASLSGPGPAGAPPRRWFRQAVMLGCLTVVAWGVASIAEHFLSAPERPPGVADLMPLGEVPSADLPASTGVLPPERAPTAPTPDPALSSSAPRPPAAASEDRPPTTSVITVPGRSSRGAGSVANCVTPPTPAVAFRGNEVLGTLVGVKVDADSEPPRCLYVVERPSGAFWMVDSLRVQLRPR